jgi:hypothetical protein
VPDFRSNKTIRLDGVVGGVSDAAAPVTPVAAGGAPTVQVLVSGEELSGLGVMGLNDGVRLLVNAFIHGKRSGGRETIPSRPAADGEHSYIEVALHGLSLAPHDDRELRQLIRQLIHERIKNKGASK